MQRQYQFVEGNLLTGGFAQMGFTGFINKHIKKVQRVSSTEVKWEVENEYGELYTVTVTATKPSGDDTKRINPQITITAGGWSS